MTTIEPTTIQDFIRLMIGRANLAEGPARDVFQAQSQQILSVVAEALELHEPAIRISPNGKGKADSAFLTGSFPDGTAIRMEFNGNKIIFESFSFIPVDQTRKEGRIRYINYRSLADISAMCAEIRKAYEASPVTVKNGTQDLRIENNRLCGTLRF